MKVWNLSVKVNTSDNCDVFQDDFEDKERRQRQWFTVEEAQRILVPHKPNHLRYLAAMMATKDGDPDAVDFKVFRCCTAPKVLLKL